MSVRDFSKLYLAFLFFHLVLIYKPDEALLYYISKPLLMTSLLVFYIAKTETVKGMGKWKIAAALFFSLVGNIVLMIQGPLAVLAGIGAFGLVQLMYIIFFMTSKDKTWSLLPLLGSVAVVIITIWILNLYLPVPPRFMVPVSAYSALIGVSFISGIQFGLGSKRPQYLVPLGIFLFMLSGVIWCYNQFLFSHVYLQILSMLFYGLAQYFIVRGVLKYFRL